MTPKALAEELKCSRWTIHRYITALRGEAKKGSARLRIVPDDLVKVIRAAREQGLSPTDPGLKRCKSATYAA